jgi:hypothetical protein
MVTAEVTERQAHRQRDKAYRSHCETISGHQAGVTIRLSIFKASGVVVGVTQGRKRLEPG